MTKYNKHVKLNLQNGSKGSVPKEKYGEMKRMQDVMVLAFASAINIIKIHVYSCDQIDQDVEQSCM